MSGIVRLYLEIEVPRGKKLLKQFYHVALLHPLPSMKVRAWRLVKSDKESYTVSLDQHGRYECCCPDATCRQHYCKHAKAVQALRDQGLLA